MFSGHLSNASSQLAFSAYMAKPLNHVYNLHAFQTADEAKIVNYHCNDISLNQTVATDDLNSVLQSYLEEAMRFTRRRVAALLRLGRETMTSSTGRIVKSRYFDMIVHILGRSLRGVLYLAPLMAQVSESHRYALSDEEFQLEVLLRYGFLCCSLLLTVYSETHASTLRETRRAMSKAELEHEDRRIARQALQCLMIVRRNLNLLTMFSLRLSRSSSSRLSESRDDTSTRAVTRTVEQQ